MNLDDLGDFPRSPPYFGYNSAGPENPVLCILLFQDSNWPGIFRAFIFYQIWWISALKPRKRSHEGGKAPGGAPTPGRATQGLHLLEPPQPSIKSPRGSSWPKTPIYKCSQGVSSRRRRIDQKHRNSAKFCHHRRGTLLRGPHRRDLLPLQDQEPHHHDEEGVFHLWTMGL